MTTDERDKFFSWALQYYIAGRFALLSGFSPVCGNLFHHAVEMCLKGYFARNFSEAQSKRFKREWGHNLPEVWDQFKAGLADSALNRFDTTISKLDEFEDIRYPDRVISEGANMLTGIKEKDVSHTTTPRMGSQPEYRISLEEIDSLVKVIFEKSSVNPLFFTNSLHPDALAYLERYNDAGIAQPPERQA